MVTPDNGRRMVTPMSHTPSRSSMIFLLSFTLADLVHRHPTGVVAWWAGLGVAVEVPCMPTTSRGFPQWLPKRHVATPRSRLCELYCGLRITAMYSSTADRVRTERHLWNPSGRAVVVSSLHIASCGRTPDSQHHVPDRLSEVETADVPDCHCSVAQ